METEAITVRDLLGAPPESILTAGAASKAELLTRSADGRLGKVRVLEFATHAFFSGEIPGLPEPALLFSVDRRPEDELLMASEAATLKLNAEWVILSACDTASPDTSEVKGLSGLSRAFFFAGAHSLLVSHWHVNSNDTAKLIPAVLRYESEQPKLSRSQDLQKAILYILDNVHALPFYWSPFVLVGEP